MATSGPEIIEQAEDAGLILDPWQQFILTHAMGEGVDGNWSAFEVGLIVGRQNGKGAILEALTLFTLVMNPDWQVLHSAHLFKTAADAFRRVLALFEQTPDLKRKIARVNRSHGEEGIELVNGSRVRFMARSKGSGRGLSADLVIYDEAYALTDEHIEAQLPTLSARANPQVWYTSSPPLDGETGEPLFALRDRFEAGDPNLAYFDYGAAGDLDNLAEIDLDDRELWRVTNPAFELPQRANGSRGITEQFIERERGAMTDAGFARERLCIWPKRTSTADNVIDPRAWAAIADRESQPGPEISLCIDLTPKRDHASIGLFSPRADGLGHIELIDYRTLPEYRSTGVRWIVPALLRLIALHNPVAIALDANGPALSLLDELAEVGIRPPEDPDRPERGQLAIPTAAERAAAYGQMIDAVIEGELRHRNQPLLNLAVNGAKTRVVGDLEMWTRRKASVDISPLITVTLARWAHLSRFDLVSDASYDLMSSFG